MKHYENMHLHIIQIMPKQSISLQKQMKKS